MLKIEMAWTKKSNFPPQKIDPEAPKMKISENFQNHQEWCTTSPEHENELKYMILDEF